MPAPCLCAQDVLDVVLYRGAWHHGCAAAISERLLLRFNPPSPGYSQEDRSCCGCCSCSCCSCYAITTPNHDHHHGGLSGAGGHSTTTPAAEHDAPGYTHTKGCAEHLGRRAPWKHLVLRRPHDCGALPMCGAPWTSSARLRIKSLHTRNNILSFDFFRRLLSLDSSGSTGTKSRMYYNQKGWRPLRLLRPPP